MDVKKRQFMGSAVVEKAKGTEENRAILGELTDRLGTRGANIGRGANDFSENEA